MPGGRVLAALLAGALIAPAASHAITPTTVRASLTASGSEIASYNALPAVSDDGRWVAFDSYSDAVVPGDANLKRDVFLRDMHTGQVRLISQRPDGTDADDHSAQPSMSRDGRFIAFLTWATNLAPGTTNSADDIYVYDRVLNTLKRLSTSTTGGDGDVRSFEHRISSDGTHVVFTSGATNLIPGGDTNGYRDIYLANVQTGALTKVSRAHDGGALNLHAGGSDVSDGGRFVSYNSDANNVVLDDANGKGDVFVRDLQTGVTTRESVSATGGESNGHQQWTNITADGCLIAFNSDADNLVAGTSTANKVMVRNRCQPNTEVASLSNAGTDHGVVQEQPELSDDGCAVAFITGTAIVSPPPGVAAAILRDRCAGATTRLDVSTTGDLGNGSVDQLRMSPNGRYAAFDSGANNLVPGDGNATFDAFVRDRATARPPIADLQVSVDGRRVTVDATASWDPDNGIASATISFGDGTPDATGLTATHDYARDGAFTVTLVVRDRDDLVATASRAVTVTGSPAGPPPPPPGGGPGPGTGPGPGIVLPPLGPGALELSGGVLSRTRFAVVPRGRRIGGKLGARLLVNVSEDARLELRFERLTAGRRVRGRCRAGARRGTRCTIAKAAGSMRVAVRRGDTEVALTGRVAGKALALGRHRLRAVAIASDGRRSATLTRSFTITKR